MKLKYFRDVLYINDGCIGHVRKNFCFGEKNNVSLEFSIIRDNMKAFLMLKKLSKCESYSEVFRM